MFKNMPPGIKKMKFFSPLIIIASILLQILLIAIFTNAVNKILDTPISDFPLHLYMNPPL